MPGFKKGAHRRWSDEALIEGLRRKARSIKKNPSESDLASDPRMASPGTYKNRFGSLRMAHRAAGLDCPTTPTKDQLVSELQRLRREMGKWPSQTDITRLRREGSTPWGWKVYYRQFSRSYGAALEAAGAPKRVDTSERALTADIRRVAALDLPDKPAGQAPAYKHIIDHGEYSETCYKKLGETADDWVRAAGLTPQPLRRKDAGARVADDYRQLAERLKRVPSTRDLEDAGIDFSAIHRHFGSLAELRIHLGLPPESPGTVFRGEDGLFYDSPGERDLANCLLTALKDNRVWDYEPHWRLSKSRRWTVDFRVVLAGGSTVLIEYDGLGPARAPHPYSVLAGKIEAISRRGADLRIVSPFQYHPAYGTLFAPAAFVDELRSAPASAADLLELSRLRWGKCAAGTSLSFETIGLLELAEELEIAVSHLALLHRRGAVTEAAWIVDAQGRVEPRFVLKTAIAEARRYLDPAQPDDEFLTVPALANEIRIDVRPIHRAIARGLLLPDCRAGRGRSDALFRRTRVPAIRETLGETLSSVVGLLPLKEFAKLAYVSPSQIGRLVRDKYITPAGRHLGKGGLTTYFGLNEVRRIPERFKYSARVDSSERLTASQLAARVPCGISTVHRHIRSGELRPIRERRPNESGGARYLFHIADVDALRAILRLDRPPPSCGRGDEAEEKLIAAPEVAESLGVSRNTVTSWIRSGKLVPVKYRKGPGGWNALLSRRQILRIRRLLTPNGKWDSKTRVDRP